MSCRLPVLALAMLLAASAAEARKAPPLMDELMLDLANPRIDVKVGDRTLHLSVDLAGRDTLELNPDVAYTLGLKFEPGAPILVGPIQVDGTVAGATVDVAGYPLRLTVSTHARPCCFGVDGTIGPDLLPYRTVRFVRKGTAVPGQSSVTLPLRDDSLSGLHVRLDTAQGRILLQFGLTNGFTLATYSAGARIAGLGEGRLTGAPFTVAGPFGLPRQARLLSLSTPVTLGTFAFRTVPVRISDYRGAQGLPEQAADPDDIVVEAKRRKADMDWPSIVVGQDQLKRCDEIVFRRDPAQLELRCAPPASGG